MKFCDLDIGARFRFKPDDQVYTKTARDRFNDSGNASHKCYRRNVVVFPVADDEPDCVETDPALDDTDVFPADPDLPPTAGEIGNDYADRPADWDANGPIPGNPTTPGG